MFDQRLIEQAFDQIAPVGNVRADHRSFEVAEVHAQDALGHAHGALVALVVIDQFAQVNRRGELHAGFTPEDDDAQQPAQTAGDCPAVGEQQFPRAVFAVWRLAPEHADRNDLRVFGSILCQRADQTGESRRRTAFVLAAEPVRVRCQIKKRRRFDQRTDRHRQHRAGQAGLGALGVDHRQIGQRRVLQDVEHRTTAVEVKSERRLIDGLGANPEIQQAAQGAKHKTAERGTGHTASA